MIIYWTLLARARTWYCLSPLIIMLFLVNYTRSHTSCICRAWCLCWRTGTARSSSWCSRATSPSSLSGSSPSTTSSLPWTRPVSIPLYSCHASYFSAIYLSSYCFMPAITEATPNYSVCACTVIGNRYILWSYSSTQLGKWYGIIFLCDISPFINAPLKVEEVFALFPHFFSKSKATWELSRILRFDLTWFLDLDN